MNLNNSIKFKKCNNLYPSKMQIIIVKKIKRKSKNKNKS